MALVPKLALAGVSGIIASPKHEPLKCDYCVQHDSFRDGSGPSMKAGFLVNPIAGMGGAVGLKGTDGPGTAARARALGAEPLAGSRASRALRVSGVAEAGIDWFAPRGEMGSGLLAEAGLCPVVLRVGTPCSAKASRDAARMMVSHGVDLIVFAGGDGTARDIAGVVGSRVPLLGIPCGVKMHSGVFAIRPEAAGRLIADVARGGTDRTAFRLAEIMDIDEEALREGRLDVRLYDHVQVPYIRDLIQNAKSASAVADEVMLDALGNEVADEWEDGTTYLIGPGTTAKRPIEALGLKPSLLGLDIVRNRRLIASDATVASARAAGEGGPLSIITGVTGGQGFVFGRGNQQIDADLIRRSWPDAVTILASAEKLACLPRPELVVDTGDPSLDAAMRGYVRVRTGPRRSVVMRLV